MIKSAKDLVGKYVRVKSDRGGGADLIGLFYEAGEEDPSVGHVYVFDSQRRVPVAANNCSVIEVWDMTSGFIGLTVLVPDFGEGVVFKENVEGSALVLQVRNGRGQTTRAHLCSVQVVVPN